MALGKISLKVLTPDGITFAGSAELVELPGADGEIGILHGHARMFTALDAGSIRIHDNGGVLAVHIAGGHARIYPDRVEVLAFAATRSSSGEEQRACTSRGKRWVEKPVDFDG